MKKIVLKKKHKKLIAAAAALLVVLVAAGYTVFIASNLEKEEWVYKEVTVEKGELAVGVTESGTLEFVPTTQVYDLDLGSSDDSEEDEDEEEETYKYLEVESVRIAVGQRIGEGDVILSFTEESVQGVRKLLETQVSEAEVELAEAKSEYNLEVLDVEATYQKRLIEAEGGQSKLDAVLSQPAWNIKDYQNQITLLYEEIVSLNEQWQTVETTRYNACAQYNELHETLKDITDNVEYAKLHDDYVNAKKTYENAMQKQADIKEQIADCYEEIAEYETKIANTDTDTEVFTVEGQQEYETAMLAGELAASVRDTELEKLMTEVESVEKTLEECRSRLSEFESFVGDGKIYADKAGIVTEIGYEAGDDLVSSGTIISYTTAEDMKISVDVSQEDIVDLTVGDMVDIEFSAYEDELYTGVISSIKTTSTSEYAATVSYAVVIDLKGDTSKLYGGMTADVTFVTEKKADVVYVSRTAVIEENGKHYVYVKNSDGEMETKEVTPGIENTIYVEIVEGLQEGDTVYAASKVSKNSKKDSREKENTSSEGSFFGGMEGEMPEGMDFEMPEGMDFEMPEGMDFEMPGGQMPTGNNGMTPPDMGGQRPDFGR